MYHNGQWGTICDENWSHEAAEVVCKELGYSGAIFATKKAFSREGSGPVRDCLLYFNSTTVINYRLN